MKSLRMPLAFMGLLGLGLVATGLSACSRGPTLLVTVENIPDKSQSLQVITAHSDVGTQKVLASINDLPPYALSTPAPNKATFLLQLPGAFNGDINVSVATFAGADASGCLLATGAASQPMFVGRDETLRVPLDAFTDTQCNGKKPMLTKITPTMGSTAGGETVTLSGWGFKPNAAVTMGSKPGTVTFKNASTLEVLTPKLAGFGLVNVKVQNTDMKEDARSDLFRFYAPSLSFTGFPFNNDTSYVGGGLVISHFDPTTQIDAAIALPNDGKVKLLYVINQMVQSNKTMSYTVGTKPGPIVSADFDKDGDNDLFVANVGDGTVQFMKNNGDGTFQVGSPIVVGVNPEALAAADLDGDGSTDLVVALRIPAPASGKVVVLLNDGTGTLTSRQSLVDTGIEPVGLATGDFNTDGLPDIAIANRGMNANSTYGVTLLFNQTKGFFTDRGSAALTIPSCAEPTSVLVKDVNNNGIDDLLIACSGENRVQIWDNSGGLNVREISLTTDGRPRNLAFTDLNGDGFGDLIVPCESGNSVNFFMNKLGSGFEGVQPTKKSTVPCLGPTQIAFLDVDNDKKTDVGVAGNGCISGLFNQSL